MGHPVAHSLSPKIHQLFARPFNIALNYKTIDAASTALFRQQMANFFAQHQAVGMNVTLPYKTVAYQSIANQLAADSDLHLSKAANTLWQDTQGNLTGTNTDGHGLLTDLEQNLGVHMSGRSVLLLGAGGAAAGILPQLIRAHPKSITVVNRNPLRAEQLVARFRTLIDAGKNNASKNDGSEYVTSVNSIRLEDCSQAIYDLIINATSVSLNQDVVPFDKAIVAKALVYDLAYHPERITYFNQWALRHGARQVFDGMGMLVEQAAKSFMIWHGVQPDTSRVIALLKKHDR